MEEQLRIVKMWRARLRQKRSQKPSVVVMTERLGIKPMRKVGSKEPWSRIRLEGQINEQRKDLSQLE